MKKQFAAFLLLSGLALSANAQTMDPDKLLGHLAKDLHLSEEQKAQIRPALVSEQEQVKSFDPKLTKAQKKAKFLDVHNGTSAVLRTILTPEQQQKYDEIERKMRSHLE